MSWIIESVVSGRCIGLCEGRFKFTSPELAVRFERREDAEAMILYLDKRIIDANTNTQLSLEAREHLFNGPAPTNEPPVG